jgi:hypothetical protein
MEQSISYEADSRSTGQEIHRLLWNQKVYYRVRTTPPLEPILNQLNAVRILPPILRSIIALSTYQHLCTERGQVVDTPASYLGGPGFTSRPGDRLS